MPTVEVSMPEPVNYMIRDLKKFNQDLVYEQVRLKDREPDYQLMAETMMASVKYKPELLSYRMAMMTAEIFGNNIETWQTKRNWVEFINYLNITGNRK